MGGQTGTMPDAPMLYRLHLNGKVAEVMAENPREAVEFALPLLLDAPGDPCCEHCRHEVQPDGHLVGCRECQSIRSSKD